MHVLTIFLKVVLKVEKICQLDLNWIRSKHALKVMCYVCGNEIEDDVERVILNRKNINQINMVWQCK